MGNLAKGSPLIKKLFFVSYLTRAESHRAGTGKENPRIYPWKRGKEQPRGYRERKPVDIPVEAWKRAAARVQGEKFRG